MTVTSTRSMIPGTDPGRTDWSCKFPTLVGRSDCPANLKGDRSRVGSSSTPNPDVVDQVYGRSTRSAASKVLSASISERREAR